MSDEICECLLEKGITQAFGIIGSSNAWLFDSFKKNGINILCMHHEQACVMAASGYFKTNNKPAVVIVAAGGGATNAVTGVASLWADSCPCIILAGQEKNTFLQEDDNKRMYGMQGVRGCEIIKTITKFSKTYENINDIENAYNIATTGRMGPVWIDIPMNMQSYDYGISELLKSSKKPVILAGHGVKLSNSEEKLQSIHVPILKSWSCIDLKHVLARYGCPGIYGNRCANKIIQKCDLLIVLGSRLSIMQTGYDFSKFAKNAKIVMINIDDTDFKGHINIKMNCKYIINRLKFNDVIDWIKECDEIKTKFPFLQDEHNIEDGYTNSYKFLYQTLSPLLKDEVIVTDMGTALISGHNITQLNNNKMFSSYGLGEMGYGLPASIGAAINGSNVICLNCDGSMMMNLQELQTIKSNNLNIKIIIFNNNGYLSIKHTQNMFGHDKNAVDSSSGVNLPDYKRVFNSFDIPVYDSFEEFINNKGPSMFEVFMHPEQLFVPKVQATCENGVVIPGELD